MEFRIIERGDLNGFQRGGCFLGSTIPNIVQYALQVAHSGSGSRILPFKLCDLRGRAGTAEDQNNDDGLCTSCPNVSLSFKHVFHWTTDPALRFIPASAPEDNISVSFIRQHLRSIDLGATMDSM